MSYIILKKKVKDVIAGSSLIKEVSDYPRFDFDGYPACMVRAVSQSSEYESTCENYEEYEFVAYVLQPLDGTHTSTKCYNIIEEATDSVRNIFDKDEMLSGVVFESSQTLLGLRPTSSTIYEEESGKYIVGEIRIIGRISRNIKL